jgi:DNA polymerase-2
MIRLGPIRRVGEVLAMAVRGFILHPTYRIEAGRAVVHLFGRLETGDSFLIRDSRLTPYFFIRASDAAVARELGAVHQQAVDLETMRGEPVVRVEIPTPPDTTPLRENLHGRGVRTHEADVRFAIRYLIDRGIRGALAIDEASAEVTPRDARSTPAVDRIFQNPEVHPTDWRPDAGLLKVLSLDIETDPRGRTVYSAALSGAGADEVHLAAEEGRVSRALATSPANGRVLAWGNEKRLLAKLLERLREIDFDILTGWNVIDFDLAVLVAAARRLGIAFEIGRLPGAARVTRDTSFWGRSRAEIAGRVVLDGIDLLKGAFVKLEDYRLDTAARALLGEGKVELDPAEGTGSGRDRAEAIERAFRDDLPRFIEYNRADALLVLRILEKARLIELVVERSLLTGMPPDRVGGSIASFDFLYLHQLRRRGRVAPSLAARNDEGEPTAGGAVLEPAPGLHENVLAFDFKSLYPSLIRTFNIDPLGHVAHPTEADDLIRAPNGACFRRGPAILPELLRDLFPRREKAKREGNAIAAHALKILMNSFYGVLATPACRFHSGPVANAITHFGQWVLHWGRDRMERRGLRVLYGDTDSLFVLSGIGGSGGGEEARRLGAELCREINAELAATVRSTWGVESHLELEFEVLFLKLFLPAMRRGGTGARKRYAGLVKRAGEGEGEEILFVGMEVVRRDWTELSKRFQRGLFERLFRGTSSETVAAYLRDFVRDLRDGRHDPLLVYRKALRKKLSEYTATTPPHVKAARQMEGRVRGLIEYVMTTGGPEPAAMRRSRIDYEHYVQKQIRPIAEQVLPHLGIDFANALGEETQGRLF